MSGLYWLVVAVDSFSELEQVEVLFTDAGLPVQVRRGGRVWSVVVEPTRHFSRIDWWESGRRIARGTGVRIDYAVWLVQVSLGSNSRSQALSWELVEDVVDSVWRVRDLPIVVER
ncbi:hypothetical protein [Glutamicibacter ardleyensis]|uniref:hypothetical protein n=1 Tax=Glutamicibacter ardleyensis TaxID=225894 RepID=UPI003FCF5A28